MRRAAFALTLAVALSLLEPAFAARAQTAPSQPAAAMPATVLGAAAAADIAASATVASAVPGLPAQLADFDAYVDSVRRAFDVPGIAVAIVQDGRVVLERGFGVRKLGDSTPVDAHTMFAIASNTKAFTAASIVMLADEGKLSLDDRVIDHLPWFRMADPYITREMRVRDLLAHRSGLGLGAGDLLYWPATTYSAREVAERLRNVPISGGFRERYAYDNILFGVAQQVIEQASGMPFEAFLRTRIFSPLQMTETRYNADALNSGDNVATGHAKFDFKDLRTVPTLTWSNVAGAGGLYSSVHDLATWMRVQLDGGLMADVPAADAPVADGRTRTAPDAVAGSTAGADSGTHRLFSAKRQAEMWSVHTPMPITAPGVPELAAAAPNFAGYGLGWQLSDYRGQKLVWHTGGWPGMVSRLTLVPGKRVGVVVLTNQEVGYAFNAITMRVLDAYLDAPKTDWLAAYRKAQAAAAAKADDSAAKHAAARDARSTPSLPLAKYAATYRDAWYGDVVVSQVARGAGKAGLQIQFSRTPQLLGDLTHWQHDTFVVRWRDRSLNADAFLSFVLDADGKVTEAKLVPMSPLTDFSFDFQDLTLVPVTAGARTPQASR